MWQSSTRCCEHASPGGVSNLAAPQRDEAERVIAHLILSDPILIVAADRLLAGADTVTVTVDNRHTMDDDAIATLLTSLSHPERIHALNHNASELIDRHRRIPDTAAATTVRLLLHARHGQLTNQSTTTWTELLTARADQHLPGHARTLRRIAGPRS